MESLQKRVSIVSIAEHLGLSKTTVSAALAGNPAVRDATRARVVRAADELGYTRNLHASTLRTRKSSVIGLIVPDMLMQFFGPVYKAIDVTATNAGYTVFQTTSQLSAERERSLLDYYLNWSADGVVIGMCFGTADVYNVIAKRIPLLFIDTMPPGVRADLIGLDQYQGGWIAGQHLVQCGRRRLLYLAPPPEISDDWVHERLRGYKDALRVAGVADPVVVHGPAVNYIDVGNARTLLAAVRSAGMPFDGIFAANDFLALSAIDALEQLGVNVPAEVAIVGFDHAIERAQQTMALTTVEYPFYEIGEEGMALLLGRLHGEKTGSPVRIKVLPRLIPGASTA